MNVSDRKLFGNDALCVSTFEKINRNRFDRESVVLYFIYKNTFASNNYILDICAASGKKNNNNAGKLRKVTTSISCLANITET